jgi:two-component system, OmpR family, phosphate regulon response regulator PhoB
MSSQSNGKILVVEDEADIRDLLKFNLQGRGFDVATAATGEDGLLMLKDTAFDLLILDWMLPGVSGVQVAKVARGMDNGKTVGILMLTAKSEPENIVEGLDAGADDYMVKPFDNAILWARVGALMRRRQRVSVGASATNPAAVASEDYNLGNIFLSLKTYEVKVDGSPVDLTPSEFKLLSTMVQNKGRVLTRERLISEVQGEGVSVIGRTVDTHVFGLRKKLGTAGDLIETIRGVGYRISDNED